MARLLLIGIVMLPAGVLLIIMAMKDDGVFPQGIWQGPIVIVLGLVLIVISGRNLLKSEDQPELDQQASAARPRHDTQTPDFTAARQAAAGAVRKTIEEIIPRDFQNESVYAFALTTTDDCDHILAFECSVERLNANADEATDEPERARYKWYPGEWGEDVTHIAFEEMETILKQDSYDRRSDASFLEYQARRLWVMTKALKDVADRAASSARDTDPGFLHHVRRRECGVAGPRIRAIHQSSISIRSV